MFFEANMDASVLAGETRDPAGQGNATATAFLLPWTPSLPATAIRRALPDTVHVCRKMARRILVQMLLITLLMAAFAATLLASAIEVMPTNIKLSAQSSSELLTVRNVGDNEVRIQLSVAAWNETPDGQNLLTPTEDIVFFPELLTVAPGESAQIRVGSAEPPGADEKTYRLSIQELPNLTKVSTGLHLQMLTQQSIPIFVEPAVTTVSGAIEQPSIVQGKLSVPVKNTGSAHFIARKINVIGVDDAGGQVFSHSKSGWYVLAGGVRDFQLPLDPAECAKSRRLKIEVETGDNTFTREYQSSPDGCPAPDRGILEKTRAAPRRSSGAEK